MDSTGAGTALMMALAAVLWLIYLVPSWFKRREYLATERNAVRLQQTIRIMAQTAEAPAELRVESSARSVAEQQRILRQELRREHAAARARDAAIARAEARRMTEAVRGSVPTPAMVAADAGARRVRRTRLGASSVLLLSIVVAAVQSVLIATTGAVAGSWTVLTVASSGVAASVWALNRLAAVARTRAAREVAAPVVRRTRPEVAMPVAERPREWTPVPVPKPLYLSKPELQRAVPDTTDLVAELRAAELERRRALVAAHAEPEVVPINAEVESRFARMGIVDPAASTSTTDLDAVLRRRRASVG